MVSVLLTVFFLKIVLPSIVVSNKSDTNKIFYCLPVSSPQSPVPSPQFPVPSPQLTRVGFLQSGRISQSQIAEMI